MAEIKIECEFDFSLLMERELRESKSVPGAKSAKALEAFAMHCFRIGFKAGQLPENRPINLEEIAKKRSDIVKGDDDAARAV